jgi:AraC-like DNA-binding protein
MHFLVYLRYFFGNRTRREESPDLQVLHCFVKDIAIAQEAVHCSRKKQDCNILGKFVQVFGTRDSAKGREVAAMEERSVPATAGLRLNLSAHIVVQKLSPSLQGRRFSLKSEQIGLRRACILICSGVGEIGGKEPVHLTAPALAWLPVEDGLFVRIPAGTQGYVVWLSDTMTKNAIGDTAESAQLRHLIDRLVVAVEIGNVASMAELEQAFGALDRETRHSERGSWVYLSAQVALILVHCWRVSGLEDVSIRGGSAVSLILVRFRNLVELHFREQWTIARYANALRISHDRLHDICVRTLQRTPLELVHERLTHEAGQRLLRSGFTTEQIAADLGFRSTTYFSRFIRRQTGLSPGRYRREANSPPQLSGPPSSLGFADWP